jgi:polyhydroxybutyrate depolymerase
MKRLTWLLPSSQVVLVCLLAAQGAGAEVLKWRTDGVQREALVLAPSKADESGKAPVVFAFHGHGGDMQQAADAGLQNFGPEAVVVCMQGLPTKIYVDPAGLEPGWQQEPGQNGDRDLKFFDAVLATLRSKFAVDERRIYATGFSNGGIFAYLLWGTRAKTFAAFASVAGEIFPGVHLAEPKPLLQVAGEADDVVPFAKQLRSIQVARKLNGSTGKGEECGPHCTIYRSSKGAPVETYIHPGGHVWPLEAPAVIVKFLRSYVRAQ